MTQDEQANRELIAVIRPGDRVTFVSPQGQERTGAAVMPSSAGGWVLNMGGKHGTPGLVDHSNILRVRKSSGPRKATPLTGRLK